MSKGKLIRNIAIIAVSVVVVCSRISQFRKFHNGRCMSVESVSSISSSSTSNIRIHHPTLLWNDNSATFTKAIVEGSLPNALEATEKNANYASIVEYQNKVSASNARAQQCTSRRQSKNLQEVDTRLILECLQRSTSSLVLEYPDDADEHFNEIRIALSPWAQHSAHKIHRAKGYNGPWIENRWISHFETLYDQNDDNNTCLSDLFGPFIPIFLPWVDHWKSSRSRYPEGLLDTLRSVLRPSVPYVTVSQNDEGLAGRNEFDTKSIPNLFVFSAGGYGHVPIPLLKQDEPHHNGVPVHDRTIDVSYVGSLKNAPYGMRRKMHEYMLTRNSSTFTYEYYYGNDWRQVMRNSRFSLVPRGFGRSAYHIVEVIQMGLVPIYVYLDNDVSWVPYVELFNSIGYSTDLRSLEGLASQLQNATTGEIQQRERQIETIRTSHFSFEGTLDQIGKYMKGEKNDLRCQQLPLSVTGK
jgi:hypothetical protein